MIVHYQSRDSALEAAKLELEAEAAVVDTLVSQVMDHGELEEMMAAMAVLEDREVNPEAISFARGGMARGRHRHGTDCWCSPEVVHHAGGLIFVHQEVH